MLRLVDEMLWPEARRNPTPDPPVSAVVWYLLILCLRWLDRTELPGIMTINCFSFMPQLNYRFSVSPNWSFFSFRMPKCRVKFKGLVLSKHHYWLWGSVLGRTGAHSLWTNLSELRLQGCVWFGFWNGLEHSMSASGPSSCRDLASFSPLRGKWLHSIPVADAGLLRAP